VIPLLLCSDLDRTLLPNGAQPESAQARKKFARLVQQPMVSLAYVTGRDQQLVKQAIEEYQLPQPDYVIADVGSTVYKISHTQWQQQLAWDEIIAADWQGVEHDKLQTLFSDIALLRLQPAEKQNRFKLSYYVSLPADHAAIMAAMEKILQQHSIKANLIWSVDEQDNTGLLDLLPASAGKRQAIEFVMQQAGFDPANTVFAGDSGNDICVMSSSLQSVLVANASDKVRQDAVHCAEQNRQREKLYLAKGDFMGMNGNYSAGILEGVVHFVPETAAWLADE